VPDTRSRQVTDEVIDGLLEITKRTHQVLTSVAARHELTAQQVGLLRLLDEPVSMRAFAEELACDPSNVTGLVDRVERLGLVDRIPDPGDRRIRILTLTSQGRRLRNRINQEVARDLAVALGLKPEDHGRVLRLVACLPATSSSTTSGQGAHRGPRLGLRTHRSGHVPGWTSIDNPLARS